MLEEWKFSKWKMEVYDETKTGMACYMAAAANKLIRVAWRNESREKQITLKKEAEKAVRKVEVTVSFDEGSVIIGKESYTEGINNKAWQRRSFKVKYPSNIVKKNLAG